MIDINADTVTWVDNGSVAHCDGAIVAQPDLLIQRCQVTSGGAVQKVAQNIILTMVDPPVQSAAFFAKASIKSPGRWEGNGQEMTKSINTGNVMTLVL